MREDNEDGHAESFPSVYLSSQEGASSGLTLRFSSSSLPLFSILSVWSREAGEIECSLYQHSSGYMAGRDKFPTVSPSHGELLVWMCAFKPALCLRTGISFSMPWVYEHSRATLRHSQRLSLWHYSRGRIQFPYEERMFQCATANLGLSEVLFVFGLSGICVCVLVGGTSSLHLGSKPPLNYCSLSLPLSLSQSQTAVAHTHTLTPRGTHRADVRAWITPRFLAAAKKRSSRRSDADRIA